MPASYDFIVVGAGSAGCVLANRLSECGKYTVLLVEAGGSDKKLRIRVPIGYGFTYADPSVNWMFHAQPDPGLADRTVYWPRGKVIGGSSSINAMVYCRGLPQDFDDWQAAGAEGWDWASVHPVYERTETKARYSDGKRQLKGDGPLWVTDETHQAHPVSGEFLKAAREAGWPMTVDLNGAKCEGLGIYHNTTRKGWRCSSADAFLRPALKRGNLNLISHATVEALTFEGRRATGIVHRRNGRRQTIKANREVIVCAGAVNSPQLLQLSGLGPHAVLQQAGIETRQDMPEVGGGLQDHLAITYHYDSTVPTLNNQLSPLTGRMAAAMKYLFTRRGMLSLGINQCGGFMRSTPDSPRADMQIYCNPATYSTGDGSSPQLDPEPGFILSFQPCRPTSRGRIDITSSDIDTPPAIKPNSLSTNADCDAVLRGGRLLRQLIETPTMNRLIKRARQADPTTLDDEEMLDDFRQKASTVYHPTSTCRMGRDGKSAVLDARLRVHGIGGLRVVDASAFPTITSGNTNAPTIMLAQRGSDMILEDMRHDG
ncbi:MAG: GMC family oxidoreductase N-terminal domain-containing protein [Alphaproteobacteria bacterium]|nr:GMC family oxidoreductase N-terminal domain-containing protein [Alphaproteobacteria bacterium]